VIDLHSHILPGLDDGVATIDEAVELARAAAAEGITAIAATPHVREDYPTTPEQMEAGVAELRVAVGRAGIPIEILHGGELELARIRELSRAELGRFTIAQNGAYVLVEFPYRGWPFRLEATVRSLVDDGLTPILAHPERSPIVQDDPARLGVAVEAGALVQCTAASVLGQLGAAARAAAADLLDLGLVDMLASDDHGPRLFRGSLRAAADALGGGERALRLTRETPAAVAAGQLFR
jgi:protein-tyrosine phosphatase